MPRKCKSCREPFKPSFNTMQSTCGKIECAMAFGKKLQKKAKDADDKAFKQKVRDNDRSWHIKTLQREFNKFIRLRDKGSSCISCRKSPNFSPSIGGSGIQAGHFRSVGACPELRFNEFNVHIQCFRCNTHLSGNIKGYRPGLIEKIGIEKVEWLEGHHEPKKYAIPELKDMLKNYRSKNKAMENEHI